MSKQNKYLQKISKKRKKKKVDIDLQHVATEYEKLLNKKFCYIFSGGIQIEFQFKKENFYHLLGFHKLTDVTVVKMVENHKLKKEDFYRYVKSGKITMQSTDQIVLGIMEENIVNIQDSDKKSELGDVKAHRFNIFSEKQILELLKSDPVIDFESKDCNTDIEADKIFFKYMMEEHRHLNLFVGYDGKKNKYFISTFFLENEPGKYLTKISGEQQPLLKILSRKVIDMQNNKIIDFFVKWDNVRDEFTNSSFYRGQSRLKTWINSKHISSKQVKAQISDQYKIIIQYKEDMERLKRLFDVLEAIIQLDIPEKKESAELKLMEYDIDAENMEEIQKYKKYDFSQIKNEKLRVEAKLAAIENKLKKHKQYLPDIMELEVQEVRYIYQFYFPEIQLEESRIKKIIEEHEIFDNVMLPREFEKLYNDI